MTLAFDTPLIFDMPKTPSGKYMDVSSSYIELKVTEEDIKRGYIELETYDGTITRTYLSNLIKQPYNRISDIEYNKIRERERKNNNFKYKKNTKNEFNKIVNYLNNRL